MIKMETRYKIYRKIAVITAFIMVFELAFPPELFALTSGPTQPEFSSFEPVATTNMVNTFTGDFTYNLPVLNIPGPDGSGYALSLSYHSGTSPEQEASWVGYGWTLNPGAITRNKRGFPDDDNGNPVTYYNTVKSNRTIALNASANLETFSADWGLSVSDGIHYNNYKGFGFTLGAGFFYGMSSLNYGFSDGQSTFSVAINPADLGNKICQAAKSIDAQSPLAKLTLSALGTASSVYGLYRMSKSMRNTNVMEYSGQSYEYDVKLQGNPSPLEIGISGGVTGTYDKQDFASKVNTTAYGYMYSGNADPGNSMMDYYIEKPSPFYKRNTYMGIPFNNADNFLATAEGIGGGFRLYPRMIGVFHPRIIHSKTSIAQVGPEFDLGDNLGLGTRVGVGEQELSIKDWPHKGSTFSFSSDMNNNVPQPDRNDNYFFRFNGDLGGSVKYDDGSIVAADIARPSTMPVNVPGAKEYEADFPDHFTNNMNNEIHSGRSSYIAYHTNAEMMKTALVSGYHYLSNTQDPKLLDPNQFLNRKEPDIASGIGEVTIFNNSGQRYEYGLPVYAREESRMEYGLKGMRENNSSTYPYVPEDGYLVYGDVGKASAKVGESDPAPYASTFLLTSITTPDYVDINNNGPDEADFGGWTKFDYSHKYGSISKKNGPDANWYKWRIPYNGMLFRRGELSDPDDDMGTVISGEKEIYYLKTIETKTHKAIFYTSKRTDGLDAEHLESKAIGSQNAVGSNALQKLDSIELYAKKAGGATGQLLETVHFQYAKDNSKTLVQGIPNSKVSDRGKLTLKRVWFEYNKVKNARISPYEFDYAYHGVDYYAQHVKDKYPDIISYGTKYIKGNSQCPLPNNSSNFDPQNPRYEESKYLDSWGNYQYYGATRHTNMQKWVSQKQAPDCFDPAAWQLKDIHLPSGGEILVQYEQKDYSYVQNIPAMGMVSLIDPASLAGQNVDVSSLNNHSYVLNLQDMGLPNPTPEQLQGMYNLLYRQFMHDPNGNSNKIYFKFLYRLGTSPGLSPDIKVSDCNAEYIKGYADVKNIGYLNDANGNPKYIYIELDPHGGQELPDKVCKNFIRKERGGKAILKGQDCSGDDGIPKTGQVQDIVSSFLEAIGNLAGVTGPNGKSYSLSYFKVPLYNAKKGGGVRVKRLLMYDPGIESGRSSLYGNEYIYKCFDKNDPAGKDSDGNPIRGAISSGVAINEPASCNDDNTLVGFMKRYRQSFLNRIAAGRIKDESEGPLGSTILPAASVGYSNVIIKSIRPENTSGGVTTDDNTSNTGYTVNEYYTSKDYPFIADGQGVDITPIADHKKADWFSIDLKFFNYTVNNLWLSQGSRFIINEMNGKPKRIATYGGTFNPQTATDWNTQMDAPLINEKVYKYYKPGEKIPMMTRIGAPLKMENPGEEMDISTVRKTVDDVGVNGAVEADVTLGLAVVPIPEASFFPNGIAYEQTKMRTVLTSKVIHYPAIQKSVTTYQDGIYHTVTNLAFDPSTGNPIVAETTDGFDGMTNVSGASQANPHNGKYISYDFPAHQQYAEMGEKASNDRLVFSNTAINSTPGNLSLNMTLNGTTLTFSGTDIDAIGDITSHVSPGDLILLTGNDANNTPYYFNVSEVSKCPASLTLLNTFGTNAGSNISIKSLEILRSGKTNQLDASVGGITTYGQNMQFFASQNDFLQEIADYMNAAVTALKNGTSLPTPITIPDDVGVYVQTGYDVEPICMHESDSPFNDQVTWYFEYSTAYKRFEVYMPNMGSGLVLNKCNLSTVDSRHPYQVHYYVSDGMIYAQSSSGCNPICNIFCLNTNTPVKGVIAANANTFKDDWPYTAALYQDYLPTNSPYQKNDYETGVKGKWRVASNYTYRTSIIGGGNDAQGERNYKDAGVFDDFSLYNWQKPSSSSTHWIRTNTVDAYSPNGDAIEEKNVLGVYSTAKYGYHQREPIVVAKNTDYNSVQFESFENVYKNGSQYYFEDNLPYNMSEGVVDNQHAHSGHSSFLLTNSSKGEELQMKSETLTDQMNQEGLIAEMWVRKSDGAVDLSNQIKLAINGQSVCSFNKVAQTGEWTLYRAVFNKWSDYGVNVGDNFSITLHANYVQAQLWFDDVRVRPAGSTVNCYVYDVTSLRLMTRLDDQNFGMYYQYNGEGKLVRKIAETKEGLKTVQESEHHMPFKNRQ